MLSNEWIGILSAIPYLLTFLFYVIALIFVIVKKSDRRRAKTLVTAGLATLILSQIGTVLFRYFVISMASTENIAFLFTAFGHVTSVAHAGAICLFIAAGFSRSETQTVEQTTITGRVPTGNKNPYAAPAP